MGKDTFGDAATGNTAAGNQGQPRSIEELLTEMVEAAQAAYNSPGFSPGVLFQTVLFSRLSAFKDRGIDLTPAFDVVIKTGDWISKLQLTMELPKFAAQGFNVDRLVEALARDGDDAIRQEARKARQEIAKIKTAPTTSVPLPG